MQEVHISKKLKMIDSPGIVADPGNPGEVMALRSLEVEENEKSPLEAANTLLKQCNQQHVSIIIIKSYLSCVTLKHKSLKTLFFFLSISDNAAV